MLTIRNLGVRLSLFLLLCAGCGRSVDCDEACADCQVTTKDYCHMTCENDAASEMGCGDLMDAYLECKLVGHETCVYESDNRCDDISFQLGQCVTDFCREEPDSEYC